MISRWMLALMMAAGCAVAQVPVQTSPVLHDPSTLARDAGLYWVYSSGKGISIHSSPDLVHWTDRGRVFDALPEDVVRYAPGNDGHDAWAPDIVKLGDTFYLYYAVSKWDSFQSAIGLATNTTLNPDDAAYHWTDRGMVVRSGPQDNMNDIDPGVTLAPDGKLWLCFGSYHGTIDLVQLNPKTGMQLHPSALPWVLAHDSEASDIIFHGGWYYLFVNHGSCCQGPHSTYHINVGRSRNIRGPYEDRRRKSLNDGPGEPFLATDAGLIGPGHFGLIPAAEPGGQERFSMHYEAAPESNGRPVLAVRELTWSADGWPVAGVVVK